MIDDKSLYAEQAMFDFLETGVSEESWKEDMIKAELLDAGRTYYEFNAKNPLELEKNSPTAFVYGMKRMLFVDAVMSTFFADMDEPTIFVFSNPERKGIFGRVRKGREITYAEIWVEMDDGEVILEAYDLAGNYTLVERIDDVISIAKRAETFSAQASETYWSSPQGVLDFLRSGQKKIDEDFMEAFEYPEKLA